MNPWVWSPFVTLQQPAKNSTALMAPAKLSEGLRHIRRRMSMRIAGMPKLANLKKLGECLGSIKPGSISTVLQCVFPGAFLLRVVVAALATTGMSAG